MAASGRERALTSNVPVVVHLVHGTWPFGFFGRWSNTAKAWFEDGSAVRNNIQTLADRPIQFREFRWSGRNSLNARSKASDELYEYLNCVRRQQPNAKHVIVAHSHGGTVAMQALSVWRWHAVEPPIKALVCLSTPFAYLSQARIKDSKRFIIALATTFTIPIVVVLKSLWHTWWFLPTALFLCPLLFTMIIAVLSSLPRIKPPPYYVPLIRSDIPTFILRATRDEAALTIGFTQSINALLRRVYRAFDEPSWTNNANWLSKLIAFLAFYGLGTIALNSVFGAGEYADLYSFQQVLLIFIFTIGVASIVYIGGHTAIGLTVGSFNILSWASAIIEIDAVPPYKECSVRCFYGDLEAGLLRTGIQSGGLRHGIYDLPLAQINIAAVIRAVADDMSPRLATEEELNWWSRITGRL